MTTEVPAYFSKVFGMGAMQGVYVPKKFSRTGNIVIAVIFLGLAGLGILIGGFMTIEQISRMGTAVTDRVFSDVLFPTLCITSILGLIGLAAAWGAYSNWKKGAVVYTDGLAYSDRKGVRQMRWMEIKAMTSAVTKHYRNGIYTGTTHVYTLWDSQNNRIVLNDALQQVEDLAEAVRKQIFPHLYKAAADRYNTGQPIVFGEVSLQKGVGIEMKKKKYSWDDVAEVSIHQGILRIKKKDGGWFSGASVPVSTIPNLDVLLSILNQVVGLKTGR